MKSFNRIILHVGPHKTGSSAVQMMCDENRDILAQNGILYPKGRSHGQIGSYFAESRPNYVYCQHSGILDINKRRASDNAYKERLERTMFKSSLETLVLSYEGFVDLNLVELVRFREFLDKYARDVQVVGYCRHPLSFAPSEISQRCRMGVPTGLRDARDPPIPLFKDYFAKFQKTFGKEHIHLSDFAAERVYRGDVRLDFLNQIGLPPVKHNDLRIEDNRANESLSAEAAQIAEMMVHCCPRNRRGNLFFMKYNELLSSIKGTPLVLSEADEAWIMEASEPHLSYLEDEFELTLLAPRPKAPSALFGQSTLRSLADHFLAEDLVTQAYHWLLGRSPESDDIIFGHLSATDGDWARLRAHIMRSPEFHRGVAAACPPQTATDAANGLSERVESVGIIQANNIVSTNEVTVCMIVFNEEEFLPTTLKFLAAHFRSFVIGDMGSSDRSLECVEQVLGEKAIVVSYPRQKFLEEGYSGARNFCAGFAKSAWILTVDADEVLMSGVREDGVSLDCPSDKVAMAQVEIHNLKRPDSRIPVRQTSSTVTPRRLYRRDPGVSWSGYIHEELRGVSGKVGKSSLVFDHFSQFKSDARVQEKRQMYFWMLMRAYEDPLLQRGTNRYWYEKFVPENLEAIRAGAKNFDEKYRQASELYQHVPKCDSA
jgi:hypothetical protein